MSYEIVLGDLGPEMTIDLLFNGEVFVLNAGTDTCVLRYEVPNGTTIEVTLAIVNAATGTVKRTWVAGNLPVIGAYRGQVSITRTGDTTFPRTLPSDGSNMIWWVYSKI